MSEDPDRFAFALRGRARPKALAWSWLERQTEGGPRIARPDVLAIRVAGEEARRALISAMPDVFFTEPHYRNFPAVLVWLEAIDAEHLETLLRDAWRIHSPKQAARSGAAPPAG